MDIFPTHDAAPAPAYTDPDDVAFFAAHKSRSYRARAPFSREIFQALSRGHCLDLEPSQSLAVIVTRIGSTFITTLAKVRLNQPGVYPDNDDDIRGGFKAPRPVAPAGIPA